MEENPAPVDALILVCSIIYKVIYIPGGAGFLPPTVFASTFIKKNNQNVGKTYRVSGKGVSFFLNLQKLRFYIRVSRPFEIP